MTPSRLYIIGNGFDLHHGIPSSYQQFKAYAQTNNPSLVRAVERYIPAMENWSDLEAALADFDVDTVIDDNSHFMASYGDENWSDAGHHAFQQELEGIVETLSKDLKSCFGDWIRSLPIPEPLTARVRLHSMDPAAAYLNFNYTATLQSLYAVPESNVLFIHGCAARREDALVLGHAWSPARRQSLNERFDLEDLDTRLIEGHDILDKYFGATFKPSQRLIEKNQSFFGGLAFIREVVVLGHSLSEVDAAYFHALLTQPAVSAAKWLIAVRPDDVWEDRLAALHCLAGVSAERMQALPITWGAL